jgi:hypothetical protein
VRSIFLQVPTQNEDPFTVVCNGNFLCKVDIPCPNGFKVLKVPIPGENDVDFETVTDLAKGGRSVRFWRCPNELDKDRIDILRYGAR